MIAHKNIPFTKITPWDGNPRRPVPAAERKELTASITAKGILEPVLVRPKAGAADEYELIAGRTRFAVASELIAAGTWAADATISCIVRDDLVDDADALDAALSENIHVPMHPMDQYEAFAALIDAGRDVTAVANAYGVSPAVVEQRLSLAKLIPEARTLVRDNERDMPWATGMTLASPDEQKTIVERIGENPVSFKTVHDVRRYLDNELVPMSRAMFDPATSSSGVRKDLFDEDGATYMPRQEFEKLQNGAIAKRKAELESDGWSSVEIVDESWDPFQYEDGVDDKEVGQAFLIQHRDGSVTERTGMRKRVNERIRSADSKKDEEAGEAIFGGDDTEIQQAAAAANDQDVYSETKRTREYLEINRTAIAQTIMLDNPKLAAAVTLAGLVSRAAPAVVDGDPFIDTGKLDEKNPARIAIERRLETRRQILDNAGISADEPYPDLVAKLADLDEDASQALLNIELTRRVCTRPDTQQLYDVLVERSGKTVSDLWRPDRTYLETLTKGALTGLAKKTLPDRIADKIRGTRDSMAAEIADIFEDAYAGGQRLGHAEQDDAKAFAPEMLGGAPIDDDSSSFEAEALFGGDAESDENVFGSTDMDEDDTYGGDDDDGLPPALDEDEALSASEFDEIEDGDEFGTEDSSEDEEDRLAA